MLGISGPQDLLMGDIDYNTGNIRLILVITLARSFEHELV